ncbi:Uncharacterised protein [Xylophilus ampelinus]|nr:Uncharacterised protein [Xylophilus ampelinus]
MQGTRLKLALMATAICAATLPAVAGNSTTAAPPSKVDVAQGIAVERPNPAAAHATPSAAHDASHVHASANAQTGQKTRAQVNAEAIAWVASGMSQLAYGEVGMDSMGPIYGRAAENFGAMSAGSHQH